MEAKDFVVPRALWDLRVLWELQTSVGVSTRYVTVEE